MSGLFDWLFPWRVRIRSLEAAVIEQARANHANRENWVALAQRVGTLEKTWEMNFTLYGDLNQYEDSHIALFGRDRHGPVVVIRKVHPADFQQFLHMAKRLGGPARLGGIDGPDNINSIANRTWRDTGRVS